MNLVLFMYKKCHLHSELEVFSKSNMSEHSIQLTGLFCLLQETEERTDEAEAKKLAGGGGVNYIL